MSADPLTWYPSLTSVGIPIDGYRIAVLRRGADGGLYSSVVDVTDEFLAEVGVRAAAEIMLDGALGAIRYKAKDRGETIPEPRP